MKIVDARVIVCSPGRNFVTLKIITEDGVYGLGDATLNGRELAVASYLNDHVLPLLIGRDARRIEDTWQYLYKGAYWRGGPVMMTAIAAVDTELWDIKAKSLGVPLYQLLGGRSRENVMVYGHANGKTVDESVLAVAEYVKLGYKAIRVQSGIPGLSTTYGVGRGALYYEPAEKGMPLESQWSTERYMVAVPRLFERIRSEFGPDVHLLHDAHHRLTPIEAGAVGKSLEPYRLFWFEDPVPAELQEGFRLIRQHTTTPLAVGEVFATIFDCQKLIQEQLIDYIRTTVLPRAHRLPGRDRLEPGVHGRRAPLRHQRAQLRNPGVHAAHARDRQSLPSRLHVRRGGPLPGRQARARRGHRRGTRAKISVRARVSSHQPQARRYDAQLVTDAPLRQAEARL